MHDFFTLVTLFNDGEKLSFLPGVHIRPDRVTQLLDKPAPITLLIIGVIVVLAEGKRAVVYICTISLDKNDFRRGPKQRFELLQLFNEFRCGVVLKQNTILIIIGDR